MKSVFQQELLRAPASHNFSNPGQMFSLFKKIKKHSATVFILCYSGMKLPCSSKRHSYVKKNATLKKTVLLQYKRQNSHRGDYHLEMLQTLVCQDWELRSSGNKNCDIHQKEKVIMKESNGSLKDSPWGHEWYVYAIPELMRGKWVTRAGLRTPSAKYYFKPGDHLGYREGCPWGAGQRSIELSNCDRNSGMKINLG